MTIQTTSFNSDYQLCIIGNNAKSVAAATALTYFGYQVHLYALSQNTKEHVKRYEFDLALCEQWRKGLDNGLLSYYVFNSNKLDTMNYDGYWVFLDQLPDNQQQTVFDYLQDKSADVYLSGVITVGLIDEIAQNLNSLNVFYIPFSFMRQASVFEATITPKLLLIGEKAAGSALINPILQMFIAHAEEFQLANIKTIEFARCSMMTLIASKLSLVNEMAKLADVSAVDMIDVAEILQKDERIGTGFLRPSWGFGGSTLPKELSLLKQVFLDKKIPIKLIEEVENINSDQKQLVFRKFWQYFDSNIERKVVVIWGAGYKAGTGRIKGSAILSLLPLFWGFDIDTYIYDLLAQPELQTYFINEMSLMFVDDAYSKLNEADALFIINWSDESRPNIEKLNEINIPIFDARNLLTAEEIGRLSCDYTGIGRGS